MSTFELIDADGFALTDTDGFAVDSDCPGCCGTGWIVGSPCYQWAPTSIFGEGVTVYMAAEDVPTCFINQCHRFEPGPGVGLDSIPEPREQLDPPDLPYVTSCCDAGTPGSGTLPGTCPPCVAAEITWYPDAACETETFRRCCWHAFANVEWECEYVLTIVSGGPGTGDPLRTRVWRLDMFYVGTYDPTRSGSPWLPDDPMVRYRFTDSEDPASDIDEMREASSYFAIPCSNPLGINGILGVSPVSPYLPTRNGPFGYDCYGFTPEPGVTRVAGMAYSFSSDGTISSLVGTNSFTADPLVVPGGTPWSVSETADIRIGFTSVRSCADECDAEAPMGLYRAEGYW